jgi:DNA-directed RNA polymerase specialized sigma24 family protein
MGRSLFSAPSRSRARHLFRGVRRVTETHDVKTILAMQDWSAITKRLVAYAHRRLRRRSIETAKEIAQEALTRIWDPEYAGWDPAKEPMLLRHLGSVVNGIVRNLHVSMRERAAVGRAPEIVERLAELPEGAPDGRSADGRMDARKIVDRLLERTGTDEIVSGIVLLMAEGIDRPAEQAAALDRTVRDIYNARRRLKDHGNAVRAEFPQEQDHES